MAKCGYGWVGLSAPEWAQFGLNPLRRWDFQRWIRQLGLQPEVTIHPRWVSQVTSWIENNPDGLVYFATGHGDQSYAQLNPDTRIYPSDIQGALQNRGPMVFSFITLSEAMSSTDPGTWAYELRKGEPGTAVVGVKHSMADAQWFVFWRHWANRFFNDAGLGMTFKTAFDRANIAYPAFLMNDKVWFDGDETVCKKDLI